MRQRHSVGVGHAGSWRHRPGGCGTNWRRARLRPALEGFDDDHASAAARTRRPRLRWFNRFIWLCWRRHREELPGACDIGLAAGAREQAIVPNAVKTLRQYVQHEAPDEFICGQRHRAMALDTVAAIILVVERDATFVERDQPAVGDGDAVRVARQISEHRLRPAKRRANLSLVVRGQRLANHINLVAHVLAQDAAEACSITRLEGS